MEYKTLFYVSIFILLFTPSVFAYEGRISFISDTSNANIETSNLELGIKFSTGDKIKTITDRSGKYIIDTSDVFCWENCNLVPKIKGDYLTIKSDKIERISYGTSNNIDNYPDYYEETIIDKTKTKYELEENKNYQISDLPEINNLAYLIDYEGYLIIPNETNITLSLNAYWIELTFGEEKKIFQAKDSKNEEINFDISQEEDIKNISIRYIYLVDGNKPNLKKWDENKETFVIIPRENIILDEGFIEKIKPKLSESLFRASSLPEPELPPFSLSFACKIMENPTTLEKPVVLVHGLHGDSDDYWGNIPKKFREQGFKVYQVEYSPANGDNRYNAYLIKNCLDIIKPHANAQKVHLVTHSMGGLASRIYSLGLGRTDSGNVVNYQNDINSLVMIGTPNYGAFSSNRLVDGDSKMRIGFKVSVLTEPKYLSEDFTESAFKDLSVGSVTTWNLHDGGINPNIRHLVVTGINRNIWPINLFHYESDDSDSVVSASSASLLNLSVPLVLLGKLNHINEHGKSAILLIPSCSSTFLGIPASTCNIDDLVKGISVFLKGFSETTVKNNFNLGVGDYYLSPNQAISDQPPFNEGNILINIVNNSKNVSEIKIKKGITEYKLRQNSQTEVFFHYNYGEGPFLSCIANRFGKVNLTLGDLACIIKLSIAINTGGFDESLITCLNTNLAQAGINLVTQDINACLSKPIDYGLTIPKGTYDLYVNNKDTNFDIEIKPLQTLVYEISLQSSQTCTQLSGNICTINEFCEEDLLNASDTNRCCSIVCTANNNFYHMELGDEIIANFTNTSYELRFSSLNTIENFCKIRIRNDSVLDFVSLVTGKQNHSSITSLSFDTLTCDTNNNIVEFFVSFSPLCTPNWVPEQNWTECQEDGFKYKDWIDTNSCNNNETKPEKIKEICPICTNDLECNDLDQYTLDICTNPGTINSTCIHQPIICINNLDCGESGFIGENYCVENSITRNYQNATCINPGTPESSCNTELTTQTVQTCEDTCLNGQCTQFICHNDAECDDNNNLTEDKCINPKTINANCTNTPIACTFNSDCEDSNSNTIDTCTNPGTIDSKCVNTEILSLTLHSIPPQILSDRRIQLNLTTNAEVEEISYVDWTDRRPTLRRLCRNCDEYGFFRQRLKSFQDGSHNVTFTAKNNSEEVSKTTSFFIDSRDPRISKTEPTRGFASGLFKVEFQEDNPAQLTLFYGNSIRNKTLDIKNDCKLDRTRYKCQTEVDLSDFNGKEIEYWFELTDIAGNKDDSRPRTLDVDTTLPILNSFNFTIDRRRVEFIFNITEINFDKIIYIDNNENRPREKTLCTNLRNGICKTTKTFSTGNHNLEINIIDEAGNSIYTNASFTIL